MMSFLKTELFMLIIVGVNILLFILYICNLLKLKKLNKNYKVFIKKLGNGNNIDEMLRKYIETVDDVSNKNEEIIRYCKMLDDRISLCIRKVGMVRYSAFKDTGSDLSFALALLNDNNDGVILNGIYSREMSNIYAKQIKEGKYNNKLSEEEREALEIAINQAKG